MRDYTVPLSSNASRGDTIERARAIADMSDAQFDALPRVTSESGGAEFEAQLLAGIIRKGGYHMSARGVSCGHCEARFAFHFAGKSLVERLIMHDVRHAAQRAPRR